MARPKSTFQEGAGADFDLDGQSTPRQDVKHFAIIRPVDNKLPFIKGIKHKIFPNNKVSISVTYNKSTGGFNHGLSKAELTQLEDELGIRLDRTFWINFMIPLTDKEIRLDLSTAEGKLRYAILKAHPWVANSALEINAQTSHYIYDEVEEAKQVEKKTETKLEALSSLFKMSQDEKAEFIKLYGVRNPSNMMPSVITARLMEEAEKDPRKFLVFYKDKHKEMRIFLIDLVTANIVTKKGSAYFYNEDMIGADEQLAIAYLKDPKNQPLLIGLKDLLAKK